MKQRRLSIVSTSVAIASLGLAVLSLAPVRQSWGGAERPDPLVAMSAQGDRIFTHHFVRAREQGKDSRERVMGYVTIRDGKISLINFVSIPDDPAPRTP